MNYIFLDIDGVMNNRIDWMSKVDNQSENFKNHRMFCDKAWEMLSDVCKATDARIILSSSWRLGLKEDGNEIVVRNKDYKLSNKLLEYFDKYEIKLVGLTTNYYNYRGKQIKDCVKKYFTQYDRYVVLDDEDCDIRGYVPEEQIIKTKFETGLLPEHCEKIINYFNK